MDYELLPDRTRREIERFEKERMMIKRKREQKFGKMRRNGVKLPLKKEHLREVRNEYDSMH
jgi:hypothetical protein